MIAANPGEPMNHQPVPEPKPKGRGCFFYGCLTLVILLLAAMVAGYFAVRAAVNAFVAHYTDAEPMELPETVLTPAESEALDQRLAAFKDGVENPDAVPALVLDAREINALLGRHPELKGKVHLSLEDDQVKGKLSLPLGAFKAPIIGRWLRGRSLNGSATLRACAACSIWPKAATWSPFPWANQTRTLSRTWPVRAVASSFFVVWTSFAA